MSADPNEKGSLNSRVLKGMSANIITQGTSLIIQFCLIPVFLKFWGVELYGQWLLLYAVPSYLSFIDLGFGMTSSTLIAKSLSIDDYKEALTIFQSTLFITTVVGSILAFICFIISQTVNIGSLLKIHSFSSGEVTTSFLLLVMYIVVVQQQGIFAGIYNYNHKFHYIANVNSGARLVEFLGITLAVIFSKSIVLVSLVMLLLKVLHLSFVVYDSSKMCPWMKISFKHKDPRYIRMQLLPSLSLLLYPVSVSVLNQGVSILIGTTLGSLSLVLFNTIRTFVNSIKTFANQTNNLLLSELIKFFVLDKVADAKKFYNKTVINMSLFIFATGAMLAIFGPWFIAKWTNGKLQNISHLYISVFILEAITYNLWHANYQTYLAQNKHTKLTLYFFIASLVAIFFTYLYIGKLGVWFFLFISILMNVLLFSFTKKNLFNTRQLS